MNTMTNEDALKAAGATELAGDNATYIESLYELYLQDPDSVDADWQAYFKNYQSENDALHHAIQDQFLLLARNQTANKGVVVQAGGGKSDANCMDPRQMGVQKLISAYRRRGHRRAQLDPLQLTPRAPIEDLTL